MSVRGVVFGAAIIACTFLCGIAYAVEFLK